MSEAVESVTVHQLAEAFTAYMEAVAQMNAAMKDGVNVHGATSALVGTTDVAHDLLRRVEGQPKDTLEENVRYLLKRCPYTVRDMSGERTRFRGDEDLAGSLAITFLKMEEMAKKSEGK